MKAIYLTYAARGANAWWRYLVAIALALVLTIVFGAAVIAVGEALHILPADLPTQLQHPDRPEVFFLATGLIFGLLCLGFVLAIRWLHHKRFGDILGAWSWKSFFTGLGLWAVIVVVMALVDFAIAPSGFSVRANAATPMLAVTALAGLAVQTFAEEFVFRGYLTQGLLLVIRRPFPTALASGLLFGALHIPNGVPQAISAAVFGVVLALIAIRTGGIAFTYGLHLTNNFFAAVVLVSGGDVFHGSPGLFAQDTPQLMWWDVGVGSLALVALAYVMFRRSGPGEAGSDHDR